MGVHSYDSAQDLGSPVANDVELPVMASNDAYHAQSAITLNSCLMRNARLPMTTRAGKVTQATFDPSFG